MNEISIEIIKLVVAFVAGGGSKYLWDKLKKRNEEKQFLEKIETELLGAAHELQKRFYNLVDKDAWIYLNEETATDSLIPSTRFRLANYFGWVEICHRHSILLKKRRGKQSKKLFEIIDEISKGFSSDKDFNSQKLRLFRDDQKYIGVNMIKKEGGYEYCKSFTEFISDNVSDTSNPQDLIGKITQDLYALKTEIPENKTDRLCYLQKKLIAMLDEFDPKKIRFPIDREELKINKK